MYERELAALREGATVVTANNRLARTLRHAYDAQQAESGTAVWLTPDVVSWSAWLRRLWQVSRLEGGSAAGCTLLPDSAADYLWQRTIAELEGDQAGLPLAQFARGARAAWRLVNDWQGLGATEWTRPDLTPDQQAFLRWSGRYRDRCRASGWVDAERLPELLAADLAAGRITCGAAVVFAGFDLGHPAGRRSGKHAPPRTRTYRYSMHQQPRRGMALSDTRARRRTQSCGRQPAGHAAC